jgi:hypothetical protein
MVMTKLRLDEPLPGYTTKEATELDFPQTQNTYISQKDPPSENLENLSALSS